MKYRLFTYFAFIVLLYFVFSLYIFPSFAYRYSLFKTASLDSFAVMSSIAVIVFLYYLISRRKRDFLEYIMFDSLFYISTAPNMILLMFGIVGWDIMFFVVFWNVIPIIPKVRIPQLRIDFERFMIVSAALALGASVFIIYKNIELLNFNHISLDQEIYDTRSEYGEENLGLIRYIGGWLTKFIVPSIIVHSGLTKRYTRMTLFVIIGLLFFFINPHKSTLFITLLSVLLSFIRDIKKYMKVVNFGFVAIVLLPFIYYSEFISFTVIRRVFVVPAYLNYAYFDVFEHFKMYLSHSSLGFFAENPIGMPPATYVSLQHFQTMGHSNNGIISSGYMNFGYVGILMNLFSFYLLSSLFHQSRNDVVKYFMLPVMFTLLSSSFIQTVSTHGLIFIIILAFTQVKKPSHG